LRYPRENSDPFGMKTNQRKKMNAPIRSFLLHAVLANR